MKIKVVLFVLASMAICGPNVLAQEGPSKHFDPPKQSQHLTFSEKWNITASICRPTMQEIKQINPDRPIVCAGVYSGMGDKDDSPMFLYIEAGNIFDSSDDSEALRHNLLFVLGKYMKNDPEVSVLIFGSNNRMYLIGAQEFIYEYDRVLHGDDNLKGAWSYLEGRTTKYELSEVGEGCSKDATGMDLRAFLPELGSGKMGIIEFYHCATLIKVSVHSEPSDYHPRPAPEVERAQTATTFRGHTLGESWQSFIRTEAGLCKLKYNAEQCSKAESGASALLLQQKIENGQVVDGVVFVFQHGHLDNVSASMKGPTFADLTFLEKTYGSPFSKESNAKRGFALSTWTFSDGGEVRAEECSNGTGGFTITISVMPTPPPFLGKLHLASLDQTDAGLNSGTDGLYQSGLINGCCWEYLRFYPDGTVIEVSSTGTPAQISRWFRRPYDQSGKYEVQGSTIRFSITSPDNPDYTIDFRGQVQGDMLTLEWLSYQNGRQEHETFHLVASCT